MLANISSARETVALFIGALMSATIMISAATSLPIA